jgi:hypothetical protein
MVIDHCLALDFLLAKQEGVFAITNTSCYTYINTSGTFRLHSPTGQVALRTVPRNSDIHTGMGPNKILASLQEMVPTLSRAYSCHYSLACVWALHFKFTCQVCFLLPRIHQTTDAPHGDENVVSS